MHHGASPIIINKFKCKENRNPKQEAIPNSKQFQRTTPTPADPATQILSQAVIIVVLIGIQTATKWLE